jgi:tRNA nucleotidyltransferase/poly(A) polymerase
MNCKDTETLLEGAKHICTKLRYHGYEAYLVGGCVRDIILGRQPKDYDIATSATPSIIQTLFERTVPIGETFGVVLVRLESGGYEVTTFRTDGSYNDGRRPTNVVYSSALEDVRRRDFTINALLMDAESGEIIDHVGGRDDIQNKVIRAVGNQYDRFKDDRLRILRAIRFASQFGFEIENDTFQAICDVSNEYGLKGVSAERITEELAKIWRAEPGEGWRLMHASNILYNALPYVKHWRRNGAMQRLSLLSLETSLTADERESLAWAISLHDSLPATNAETKLRTYMRLPNNMIKRVIDILQFESFADPEWIKSSAGVKLLSRRNAHVFVAYQHCMLGLPTHPAKDAVSHIIHELQRDPPAFDAMPTGFDLLKAGIPLGPMMGVGLKAAEEAILARQVRLLKEAIEIACVASNSHKKKDI